MTRTIVVGAGIAGVAAAGALAQAGHEVTIVEARERVGGRVHTARVAGEPAELGAQVLHGSDNTLLTIPAVAAAAHPVDRTRGSSVFAVDDTRHDFALRETSLTSPTVLAHRLRALSARLAMLGMSHPTLRDAVGLLGVSQASAEAMFGWYEQVTGATADAIPLLEVAGSRVFQYHGDQESRVRGGLQPLLQECAQGLDLLLGQPVAQIDVDADAVHVMIGTGSVLTADQIILTVPPPVVGHGTLVIPGLPDDRLAAARKLALGDAVVAVLTLTEPAGEDHFSYDVTGGTGFTTAVRGHRHVTVIAKGSRAARLRVLAAQPGALAERLRIVLPDLSVDIAIPPLVTDWATDPYATGAFTAPTQASVSASATWARPWRNRLYLAGEATACGEGGPFLDRAYRSGLRAAAQITGRTVAPATVGSTP